MSGMFFLKSSPQEDIACTIAVGNSLAGAQQSRETDAYLPISRSELTRCLHKVLPWQLILPLRLADRGEHGRALKAALAQNAVAVQSLNF